MECVIGTYLFELPFPFTSEHCCYSKILLDGAEGRRHFFKERCFIATGMKDSWHTSDLLRLIFQSKCILPSYWFQSISGYLSPPAKVPLWNRVKLLSLGLFFADLNFCPELPKMPSNVKYVCISLTYTFSKHSSNSNIRQRFTLHHGEYKTIKTWKTHAYQNIMWNVNCGTNI